MGREWELTVTIRENITVKKKFLRGLDFEFDGNSQGNPGSCVWSTRVKDADYTLRYLAGTPPLPCQSHFQSNRC